MTATQSPQRADPPEWLDLVREKVGSLNYGVVQIVMHDRKVTLIERTQKTRLDPALPESARCERG